MSAQLQNRIFAFDLDGTIYTGNTLIDGADEVVHYLRRQGAKVVFFTNSSTRTVQQVYEKLTRMSLAPVLEDIHTSAQAAAIYTFRSSISKVFCIGTDGLKAELQSLGVKVLDVAETAEALVIGLDPEFTYAKLAAAMPCYTDCKIIACNRDRSYPVENNVKLPGCGPIVAAVEDALGRKVDFMAGKPNTYMLDLLSQQLGCSNTDITVIGDSYDSDIQMAISYGATSFLISDRQVADIRDTTQVADIREIIHYIG
jgi:4-nitrophenyl phosphatase